VKGSVCTNAVPSGTTGSAYPSSTRQLVELSGSPKDGFDTEREAWKARSDAVCGRVVKPSTRTVGQFRTEWLAPGEPALDAATWRNWTDYADHCLSVAAAEQPPDCDTARTQQESR
jgi:hypothetical protein